MSDNEETSPRVPSTNLGIAGLLTNNPVAPDSDEFKQPEPEPNELVTNIIKDASKVTNQEDRDLDNEDNQNKTNDMAKDLESESITPDNTNQHHRKSITSTHLVDNQHDTSTPNMNDSISNDLPPIPIRSMSDPALLEHHDTNESSAPLPIQPVESSIVDEDEYTNQTPVNEEKQNNVDQTTPRKQSASSRRTRSPIDDEKQIQLPEDNDTDRDNQEVANISRRPSISKSPVDRPRSPTPDDSRKNITTDRQFSTFNDDQDNQKQAFEPPTAIISPASRPDSTNKSLRPENSRPSSSIKSKTNENQIQATNDFSVTNEQSKLITTGEQLQIPTNDINNGRLNSPPPSPSTIKHAVLQNPLMGNTFVKTDQENSRPPSQTNRQSPTVNEKRVDGGISPTKSRQSSTTSQKQQQQPIIVDQNLNSTANRRSSNASERSIQRKDSRRSSTDTDKPLRLSAKRKQERISSNDQRQASPYQKRSAQQSRKNSNQTTEQTTITPLRINSNKAQQSTQKRLSTDSESEPIKSSRLPPVNLSSSRTTTPTENKQTTQWNKKGPIESPQMTDNEIPSPRPQSPNAQQITEHNQYSSQNKKRNSNEQKKKELPRPSRRSNSAESFNHIQLVDDKSLDSTSGNNTENEHPKPRHVKPIKNDVQTNTDLKNHSPDGYYQQQQQQESTPQKPLKATKLMTDPSTPNRRRLPNRDANLTTPDTEPDSTARPIRRTNKHSKTTNDDKDPVKVNVTIQVKDADNEDMQTFQKPKRQPSFLQSIIDPERHIQSDTEQLISEKQKKRRRPKRISRTTQTYECVFRRMEREEHEELRPTNDLDKNIQTRRSRLCPRTRSPKRHNPPVSLSNDAFKVEEILPKQFPHTQRSTSKTALAVRNTSPPNGKLIILRPTLPFHHTDAVHVQRISLQYAIDLVPNDNKANHSSIGQRDKSLASKQSERTSNVPALHSSLPSANKSFPKEKSATSRADDNIYQRKDGGAV